MATDSLGRSLSYSYTDLTNSKQTLVCNALVQETKTTFDPSNDLEIVHEDSNGNKAETECDEYRRKIKPYVNGEQ